MDDEVKSLIKRRGRVKKSLTDFQKHLTTLVVGKPITRQQYIALELKVQRFNSRLDEFEKINYEITDLLDNDDEEGELEVFESGYFEALATAKELMEERASLDQAELSKSMIDVQNNQPNSMNAQSAVKLPTISLPKFNGKSEQWLDFRDLFRALVHDEKSLTDSQKLYYLRGALEGEAKGVVQGVAASGTNYQAVWEGLCERFENKRLLIYNHLNALYNIRMLKDESAKQLRDLLDNINLHLRALEALGEPIKHWDTILIFLFSKKLDNVSLRAWEIKIQSMSSTPSWVDMQMFMRMRADMLDAVSRKCEITKIKEKSFNVTGPQRECYVCKGDHLIYYCSKFKDLSVEEREKKCSELNLCKNCLRQGHAAKDCSKSGCKRCNYKHNSLLHKVRTVTQPHSREISMHSTSQIVHRVLLATASAEAKQADGYFSDVRLLLDNGSQMNLIKATAAKRLRLKIKKGDTKIGGIGDSTARIMGTCEVILRSKISNFEMKIQCYVLNEISSMLPQFQISLESIPIPDDVQLADPRFFYPDPVDILLGAGHFFDVVSGKTQRLGKNLPVLAESTFGWIISGLVPAKVSNGNLLSCHVAHEIHNTLKRFWEIEEISSEVYLSEEEEKAEKHFRENTTRDSEGRFVVAIPFKDDINKLGNSEASAKKRFYTLERRLQSNQDLAIKYTKFMNEYINLQHMTLMPQTLDLTGVYILPHHGVVNEASATTKLRVVFDGSHPTDTGVSRNQIECVGPVVQSDLISILLRFRCHKVVITADVCKMYRQILVRPEDRCLQVIYWRDNPSNNLNMYYLNTVTYGTASGSFLATRCLVEVANLIQNEEPHLSSVIKKDIYVDDILTGANSVDEAKLLCKKLRTTLSKFGFPLQKWNCNHLEVLKSVDGGRNTEHRNVFFDAVERTKTLGIFWQPDKDTLTYVVNVTHPDEHTILTKRTLLSAIGQIFDPLGLVGACVIIPKIWLQRLWQLRLEWDDPVPEEVKAKWITFQSNLLEINKLQIARPVVRDQPSEIELHGFADASQLAYGACIYLRVKTSKESFESSLLCAKSKVAPIKSLTIPKLELCAALTLAKLVRKVVSSIPLAVSKIFLWTDSEIVLFWMRKSPNQLKIFVANRIVQIQELASNCTWRHVASRENPADLISRGLMPQEIMNCYLWWHGPHWLTKTEEAWPAPRVEFSLTQIPELRNVADNCFVGAQVTEFIDVSRFSKYIRLLKATAYVLRFVNKTRKACVFEENMGLSASELLQARNTLIKMTQFQVFAADIASISKRGIVKSSSSLAPLSPFLDKVGLLRVYGRLRNSELDFNAKHPIILSNTSKFTKLLFQFEHIRLGHAGPQLLLNSIRSIYWPLHGKALARATVHRCQRCFRARPNNSTPRMGDLPPARVTPSLPFSTTGVDYAGPFLLKDRKGRGSKHSKGYIALFICFATKAIHLEVATDLTTQTFIASFRRFAARRGVPHTVWSDNGTNFVGARNELRNIIANLRREEIIECFAVDGINWKFIPSNSPHFGGLWESGVRGVKFHLKRIVGDQILTYEEFYTVCCQIEAIVNSRPLTLLSSDSNSISPLTPGHFLVGRNITSIPDEQLEDVAIPRLSRFQLLQQLVQQFWRRWSSEYLHTLQPRHKWQFPTLPPRIGDIVLIRTDNSPPMHWPLGRITELHNGKDGICRVVTVKTAKGELRRAIHKVYPLPLDLDNRQ